MRPGLLRRTAVLSALVLVTGLAACGDDEANENATAGQTQQRESGEPSGSGTSTTVEPLTQIGGGTTFLRVNRDVRGALSAVGIEITATGEATRNLGALAFPITTGEIDLDSSSGRVEHDGGIRFSVAGRAVKASDLVVDLGRGIVTAEIAGRRVPFLAVDFGRPRMVPVSNTIMVQGAATTLAADAIRQLNDRIGVDVFDESLTLGRLTVDAEPS